MNHIGSVIGNYRNKLGLSRKDLAEGICTEKYIYMIEKGERNPSTDIISILIDRLGIDLYRYYEYLNCSDPIEVKYMLDMFNKFRMTNDIKSLNDITLKAMGLADFQSKPWIYEIEVNKYMIKVLGERNFIDSIKEIPEVISKMKLDKARISCIANCYVLLATSYHMGLDVENAKKAIINANNLIEGKEKAIGCIQVIVTVKLCKISVHYLAGELDNVIEEGLSLLKYEEEISFYERSHYTYFFLAFAYYEKDLEQIAIEWFTNALCISIIKYKPMDIHYLTEFKIFKPIIMDERVPRDLVRLFEKKYNIK